MKILVIEDEGKVANFIKKGLEQSGYEVELAADGEEGFDKFRATDFDLVLLDPPYEGGLVAPVLRALVEWRWMADGAESPWFPGFRIYRQAPDRKWDGALARLRREMQDSLHALA